MSAYTLISSRNPVDSDPLVHELAGNLAKDGHEVALFLVENGTFLARKGVCDDVLAGLKSAGVTVLADDLALRERGITDLSDGVASSSLETIIDHMAEGRRVAWH